MMEYIDIESLNPAEYNPRYLSEEAQEELKRSITELGIIKPIIIRRSDYRIMAGHQRTKTMKLLGYKKVPAFILDGVNSTDEVRFNQLHNYAECEVSDKQPDISVAIPEGKEGFCVIPNADITMHAKGGNSSYVVDLTKMIMRYGQFANAVCDYTGKVIISSIYAKTVKLMGKDLLVYVLPKGKEEVAKCYFSKNYGVFEYEHLEKKTYMQSFAQKMRLREKNGKSCGHTHSTLYERLVIPYITNEDIIDEKEIRQDCANICRTLSEYGLYDVVVCDSVLNSVNSLEDEKNVLLSCAALCKKDGMIFYSGIPLRFAVRVSDRSKSKDYRSKAIFLDAHNFTANYRFGEWYYQHYHSTADVIELNQTYIGNNFKLYDKAQPITPERELSGSSFQVVAINEKIASKDDYISALRYEFSLPLPNNRRWDLDKEIIPVFEAL